MVSLVLTDGVDVRVEYKTSAMEIPVKKQKNPGAFTVLNIIGLTDDLIVQGYDFGLEVYIIDEFIHFALSKSLSLIGVDTSTNDFEVIVEIATDPPIADWSVDELSPTIDSTIHFTDTSLNNPTSWLWKKKAPSDGVLVAFSTIKNPSLVVDELGFWKIELTATNGIGSNTKTSGDKYISCIPEVGPPIAAFVANALTPSANETIYFTDQSLNSPTSWVWQKKGPSDIGYTVFSTLQNPSIVGGLLEEGLWSIELIATNIAGSDSETKTNYINVGPPIFTFTVNGHPGSIPPGLSTFMIPVTGVASILSSGQIESILLNIDHPALEELTIVMFNPTANNSFIMLSLGSGISGNKYDNTKFLRGAIPLITSGSAPYTGDWDADGYGSGNHFDDWTGIANGTWQMQINNTGSTTGMMVSATIEFNY